MLTANKEFIKYGSTEGHSDELNSHTLFTSKSYLAARISNMVRSGI